MFENKKMPKLQGKNLTAAYHVCISLRNEKFLSDLKFKDIIRSSKKAYYQVLPQNFENIIIFLVKHNMVEKHYINGMICWAATKKCVKAKQENWFCEYQYINSSSIKKAVDYQKINDGLIASGVEGKIIAENILGLKGNTKMEFITLYMEIIERCEIDKTPEDKDRAIMNPINDIKEIKIK